jgi:NADH:ubiquinone oxidoreductase subunit 6 (subunit J)
MNKKQLALTALAYAGTIAVLIVLLFMMQGVDGADLAKQFLE